MQAMIENSPQGSPTDDEVGTVVPAVSDVGDEARVEYSRLDTRWVGKPEKFNRQYALWLDWKFQIEADFGVLGCLEVEMNSVTMTSLTTDTFEVQARHTHLTLSHAAQHIVRSILDRCEFKARRVY